jgi:hypothetical protein
MVSVFRALARCVWLRRALGDEVAVCLAGTSLIRARGSKRIVRRRYRRHAAVAVQCLPAAGRDDDRDEMMECAAMRLGELPHLRLGCACRLPMLPIQIWDASRVRLRFAVPVGPMICGKLASSRERRRWDLGVDHAARIELGVRVHPWSILDPRGSESSMLCECRVWLLTRTRRFGQTSRRVNASLLGRAEVGVGGRGKPLLAWLGRVWLCGQFLDLRWRSRSVRARRLAHLALHRLSSPTRK